MTAVEDVELVRIVFVNNSGVPRGRVIDRETLPDVLAGWTNVTHAMQSFNGLDRLAPDGRFGPAGEVRVVPDLETFTVLPYDDRTGLLLAELHGSYLEVKRSEWDQSTNEGGEWKSGYLDRTF